MAGDGGEKIRSFEDLRAWQYGHALVVAVYEMTKTFPPREIYSLTNQIRRSAISVTSNIAEGFGRRTYKDKLQFYSLAHGSLLELKSQIYIAHDVGYLTDGAFSDIVKQIHDAYIMLQGLLKATRRRA